jgi:hypothetical protein
MTKAQELLELADEEALANFIYAIRSYDEAEAKAKLIWQLVLAAQPQSSSEPLRDALEGLLSALPVGVVLVWGDRPIDHNKINYARSKAEEVLLYSRPLRPGEA